ncbi:hypothetical protein M148_3320 [Bacteroides fragilis str. 1007-1-F |nr:hypothetical protein M148_3320 [Bacteroides fragilis str. 1007-1-F \
MFQERKSKIKSPVIVLNDGRLHTNNTNKQTNKYKAYLPRREKV